MKHRWRVYKSVVSGKWLAKSLDTYWVFEFDTQPEAFTYGLTNGQGPSFTHH